MIDRQGIQKSLRVEVGSLLDMMVFEGHTPDLLAVLLALRSSLDTKIRQTRKVLEAERQEADPTRQRHDCSQCAKWTPEEGFTRLTALSGFCLTHQAGVRSDEPCDGLELIHHISTERATNV